VKESPAKLFLSSEIESTDYDDTPCFSFVLEHHGKNGEQHPLLFDLVIRKD
jgi:hypothetical protein